MAERKEKVNTSIYPNPSNLSGGGTGLDTPLEHVMSLDKQCRDPPEAETDDNHNE